MSEPVRLALTLGCFAAVLALVAIRPRGWSEAWWTVAGAGLVLALGLVTPRDAAAAILDAKPALLFLLSLLALAMLVGKSGFFEWAALACVRHARGDGHALFRNLFVLGALITAAMSLDTTAVMLTPVVLVLARRLDVPAAPYVAACAIVANVGSLLLPISNLTNLLFADQFRISFARFAAHMLAPQLAVLALAYAALRIAYRRELPAAVPATATAPQIPSRTYFRWCVGVLIAVLAGYFAAPALDVAPYWIAFACVAILIVAGAATKIVTLGAARELSWSIFPLVCGLFVVVRAVQNLGVIPAATSWLAGLPDHELVRATAIAGATAAASNLANNLPAALLAKSVIAAAHPSTVIALAPLIGADVGPIVTPLGSLATILVLALARRAGATVSIPRLVVLGLVLAPIAVVAGTWLLAL